MKKASLFLSLFVLLFQFEAIAGEKLFESGSKQVALFELYSSEGCSSCPPADRWISGLKGSEKLWKEFVPVNFHVDYWDYLGWTDRLANKSFARRQRRYANEWGARTVYTPGFVKNGSKVRWGDSNVRRPLGSEVGNLVVEKISKTKIKVKFTPSQKRNNRLTANVALLGNGLSTKVKYGENAGETLHHEFVVLKKVDAAFKKEGETYEAELSIPTNKTAGAKKFALAVWVSGSGSQKPIQAAGGYLARN